MIWLITHAGGWLLLTALFAAVAGWCWAAERATPGLRTLLKQRETVLRDLARFGAGDVANDVTERERETDATRRLLELRDGRIAELERNLAAARGRAEELAHRPSEDGEEVQRLRALVAAHEEERARIVDVEAAPAVDDAQSLQAWRLRYFERRVRYLEEHKPAPPPAPEPEIVTVEPPPHMEWRAREAEARAAHLEGELRALLAEPAPAPAEPEPFAANAEVDTLLRWRMLYLERRVAHLQSEANVAAAALAPEPVPEPSEEHERWKWRARYLEARVRHLEQRPAATPVAAEAPIAQSPPAPAAARGVKPTVLAAARNGLPDDFTLIDGLSALQQSTLNALGVFHFDQIAAWTSDNVAWVDRYLFLRGRIEEEDWVEQAAELARDGVAAARRATAEEDA